MNLGFIGSGNMARAIAVGIGQPATFCDSGSGRAQALAQELNGSTGSATEVAAGADVVFLCHKPKQLADVAAAIGDYSGTVVSVLAATTLAQLRSSYPNARVIRIMPNTPVELHAGVTAIAAESDTSSEVQRVLERLGTVVTTPEDDFETVTAVGGCAPAFFALFAKELIAAATARGLDHDQAKLVVGETLAGTGALLRVNGVDTQATMDAVASPGGLTEKALESFAASGLGATVDRAVATVLGE